MDVFRDALRPFVQRELILARIDEARRTPAAHTQRMRELDAELRKLNAELPESFRI